MSITLTVAGGSSITGIPFTAGMNVQQVLEAAYNKYTNPPSIPPLSFWLDYYGTSDGIYLGYLVTMMDGTSQQGDMYWMLYVNGTLATAGIDQTTVTDGSTISFMFQSYSDHLHGQSVMKQVHHYHQRKAGLLK